ncbi:MAG: sialidase family protein [Thermomonas sp.]|uniref:sialidase family protein n=1 Tax=Thermomonas sp. TaxID=1971895 RepID=UPI0039E4F061
MNLLMTARTAFALVLATVALAACKRDADTTARPANGDYVVQEWVLPAQPGSMAPDLSITPNGRVLLSWLNRQQGRRNALQFAAYTADGGWQSQARTVAVGHSLMANGADTPHMLGTADGALWMQWLQTSGADAMAYDTVLARSRDGGMTWTQITRVNDDQAGGEHGFAALWQRSSDAVGIAWLDGRSAGTHGEGAHAGAMQLRANSFDMNLERDADALLDARVCDCCQTAVAMTDEGPLLVYRGRSADEVRDIQAIRFDGAAWSKPATVHADGWKIEACPVNGPAVAARGMDAVVGWYTAAGDTPRVHLTRSKDAGGSFAAPVTVDEGAAALGRVAVALDTQQVWVAWLRAEGEQQSLMLARYSPDLSKQLQRIEVARLQARGLASGIPKLAADAGGAWLVWTDVIDGAADLQGVRVSR